MKRIYSCNSNKLYGEKKNRASVVINYLALFLTIIVLYLLARLLHLETHPRIIQGVMCGLLVWDVGYLLYQLRRGRISEAVIIKAIIFAGFTLRIGYLLYTGCDVRSHDLGAFQKEANGQAGYILTLIQTGHLPDSNAYQYYQQPFFYILGSIVSKVINGVLSCKDAYALVDAAKIVSGMASCSILLISEKICSVCGVNGKGKILAISIVAFLPAFILSGGRVNCDALIAAIMLGALLYTLYWDREPNWKNTIILAVLYGCGMMTKISCAVVALFTLFIFLKKLAVYLKKKNVIDLILKYLVFGAISFPLGLWYSIRNFIRFGQNLTYVHLVSEDSDLYIGNYSIWERLFSIDLVNLIQRPYASPKEDHNAPVYFLKSALFGEFTYMIPEWIPRILLLFGLILAIVVVIAVIWHCFKKNWEKMCGYLIFISSIFYASILVFLQKYKFGCSMDFRYMLFLVVPVVIILGNFYEKSEMQLLNRMIRVSTVGFAFFSSIMFCSIR